MTNDDAASGHHHHHHHEHPVVAGEGDEIAECLVMPGNMVVKAEAEAAGLFRDYKGQRYWFCCDACVPLFEADPEKYATA